MNPCTGMRIFVFHVNDRICALIYSWVVGIQLDLAQVGVNWIDFLLGGEKYQGIMISGI